jgi:hypothetical protein
MNGGAMDPFRLCLALGPVAMYLLLLGAVNLRGRPLVFSGVRDATLLALAIAGLMVVGPMELFFPYSAAAQYGPRVWLLLATLYVTCVLMVLLLLRPRLVIYNMSADRIRPVLAEVVERLDADARWAGDSLALPGLGVQLYVDHFAPSRSVSLVSAGGSQNRLGWRRLELALRTALAREEPRRNPRGAGIVAAGLLIVAVLATTVVRNPQSIVKALSEIGEAVRNILGR